MPKSGDLLKGDTSHVHHDQNEMVMMVVMDDDDGMRNPPILPLLPHGVVVSHIMKCYDRNTG